jgi:hypothetical protein
MIFLNLSTKTKRRLVQIGLGISRNGQLMSVSSPPATSVVRVVRFELLKQLMEQHKFSADRIYNWDETGIRMTKTPRKNVADKGN